MCMNCSNSFDNIIGHNEALNEPVISENKNNENSVTNAVPPLRCSDTSGGRRTVLMFGV